ncbi:MAG TPA: glycoside hydrolase family 76 protein [Chthonomonadaceae bacterium]|nr:glycoside hydrolase family 76 protein [Chthonomonadaceae bacterium]
MRTPSRREFLAGLVGSGLAAWPLLAGAQNEVVTPVALSPPPQGYAAEAARLTGAMQRAFWNAQTAQYRAPVRSAETVDSEGAHNNGYVLWPCLLGFFALVEAEKTVPGRYAAPMRAVFNGLEAYFDPEEHAYNAWLRFPGNNDKYFDDNAWLVIALVEAFEATKLAAYRERAIAINERFLTRGWDASGRPGGQRWGTDPTKPGTDDHNACSTASAALAALGLARLGVNRQANLRRAEAALDWIVRRLRDTDGLIQDGLHAPDWKVMPTKWTYNTGAPIRAYVEHHQLTGDKASLEEANRLARAATDRTKRLYDGLVRDPERRFWYDSSFFVPHLVEGLLALCRVTGEEALRAEVRRNANYAYQYLRDPSDGLYWRNWRLWRIGAAQVAAWRRLTGQEQSLEPDEAERSKESRYDGVPLAERPLVKTLLANAGMARLFWLLAQDGNVRRQRTV